MASGVMPYLCSREPFKTRVMNVSNFLNATFSHTVSLRPAYCGFLRNDVHADRLLDPVAQVDDGRLLAAFKNDLVVSKLFDIEARLFDRIRVPGPLAWDRIREYHF